MRRGAKDNRAFSRGELFVTAAVERFDPEGSKDPKGEWMPARATRIPGDGANNGFRARRLRSNGFVKSSGVEAKGQVGSVDPAMVAKASLRASERPFRVSSSGGKSVFENGSVALTRRRLKSGVGERRIRNQRLSAADRTPSMPVVRSIVP